MTFEESVAGMHIRGTGVRKTIGPFAYERDEYLFCHSLYIGSWRFSFYPDSRAPSLAVKAGRRGTWRLEVTWTPDYSLPGSQGPSLTDQGFTVPPQGDGDG